MAFPKTNQKYLYLSYYNYFSFFVAMKMQKISANNIKAIYFSGTETSYLAGEGRASISIPYKIFKGQGKVKLIYCACVEIQNSFRFKP